MVAWSPSAAFRGAFARGTVGRLGGVTERIGTALGTMRFALS